MKYKVIIALISLLMLNGCVKKRNHYSVSKHQFTKPSASKKYAFRQTMNQVARSTRNDTHYKKMSFNTLRKKIWFNQLMFKLWDRQITRKSFITQGLAKYPKHRYELSFVAHGFQIRS
jgi:hypothetical protein